MAGQECDSIVECPFRGVGEEAECRTDKLKAGIHAIRFHIRPLTMAVQGVTITPFSYSRHPLVSVNPF